MINITIAFVYLLEQKKYLLTLHCNVIARFAELELSIYVSITIPDRNTRHV